MCSIKKMNVKWWVIVIIIVLILIAIALLVYYLWPRSKSLRTVNGTTPYFFLDAEADFTESEGTAITEWKEPDLSSTYTFTGSPRVLLGPKGTRGIDLNFATTTLTTAPTFPTTGDYTMVMAAKGVSPQLFGWNGGGSSDAMHLGVTRSGYSTWDNLLVHMPLTGDINCIRNTPTAHYDSVGDEGKGVVNFGDDILYMNFNDGTLDSEVYKTEHTVSTSNYDSIGTSNAYQGQSFYQSAINSGVILTASAGEGIRRVTGNFSMEVYAYVVTGATANHLFALGPSTVIRTVSMYHDNLRVNNVWADNTFSTPRDEWFHIGFYTDGTHSYGYINGAEVTKVTDEYPAVGGIQYCYLGCGAGGSVTTISWSTYPAYFDKFRISLTDRRCYWAAPFPLYGNLAINYGGDTSIRVDKDDSSGIANSIISAGTIECWAWTDPAASDGCIFAVDKPNTTGTQNLMVLVYRSAGLNSYVLDSSQTALGGAWSTGEWEHFACSWSGTSTYIYKNGVLLHTYSTLPGIAATDRIYIAGQPNGSNPGYANELFFQGHISQFKIWDYAKYTTDYFQIDDTLFRGPSSDDNLSNTLCCLLLEQDTTDQKSLVVGTTGTIKHDGLALLGPPTTTLTQGKLELDSDDAGNLLGSLGSSGTIEGWFHQESDSTCLFTIGDESTYDPHLLGLYSCDSGYVYCMVNGTETKIAQTLQTQWIHWAVAWDSGTTRVYRDGSKLGSDIADAPTFVNADHLMLGGEADPYAAFVEVLMPLVADTNDYSGKAAITVTNASVTFSNAEKTFGQNNALFNGSSSYLHVDSGETRVVQSLIDAGEGTMEWWGYNKTNTNSHYQMVMINNTTGGNRIGATNKSALIDNGTEYWIGDSSAITWPAGLGYQEWRHVALVWKVGVGSNVYVNGVEQLPHSWSGKTPTLAASDNIFIGADDDSGDAPPDGNWWNGHICQFRITSKRRYTSNFVPPQCPYVDAYPAPSAMSHIRVSDIARYTGSTYTIPGAPFPIGHNIHVDHNGSRTQATTTLNAETDYVIAVRRASTSYVFDVNGTKLTASTEASIGTIATSDSSMGDVYSNYGRGNATIYAVAVYDSNLSDSDLNGVKSYLANRFTTTVPTVSYATNVLGYVGYAISNVDLTIAGSPTTFSVDVSQELFDDSNAKWTGTPTATQVSQVFTVTATDADAWNDTATITVEVRNTPSITYTDEVKAQVGDTVSITPTLVSMTSQTLSIAPTLPSGLSFDTGTGVISGISTQATDTSYTISTTHSDLSVEFKDTILLRITAVSATDDDVPVSGTTETTYAMEYAKIHEVYVGLVTIEPISYEGYGKPSIDYEGFVADEKGVLTGKFSVALPIFQVSITATATGSVTSQTITIHVIGKITYNDGSPVKIKLNESVHYTPKFDGVETVDKFDIDKSLPAGLQFDNSTGAITGMLTDESFDESDYIVSAQKGVLTAKGTIALQKSSKSNSLVIILSAVGGGLVVLCVVAYIIYRKYRKQ
jgi:hypothetical protein